MSYDQCIAAIQVDPLNQSNESRPLLFTESSISADLKYQIRQETGAPTLYAYMKRFHPTIGFYGVLLKTTGDIVRGPYWTDLWDDEERVYCLS